MFRPGAKGPGLHASCAVSSLNVPQGHAEVHAFSIHQRQPAEQSGPNGPQPLLPVLPWLHHLRPVDGIFGGFWRGAGCPNGSMFLPR